jgi:adenylate kinase
MTNKTFIFLGRSGCGKGTQAGLLINHLCQIGEKGCRTLHIESGSLLREFSQGETYVQKKTKETIDRGILAPEAVIVSLWTKYLIENFTGQENIVCDGAPRKIREAQLLNDTFKFLGIEKPTVICVNVSRDWSEKRLLGRARKDDTRESVDRRLAWYETDVVPVINYFRNDPYYNFIEVNGEQPIEDVHNELLAKLGPNR